MTDYDKMTDDELSAAVAERVMGWTYLHDISAWTTRDQNGVLSVHATADPYAPFRPATSWADAGRVLEKMRADEFEIAIEIDDWPMVTMQHTQNTLEFAAAIDADPRRAICIAALRAVEVRA